jgi:hypothetical protein
MIAKIDIKSLLVAHVSNLTDDLFLFSMFSPKKVLLLFSVLCV